MRKLNNCKCMPTSNHETRLCRRSLRDQGRNRMLTGLSLIRNTIRWWHIVSCRQNRQPHWPTTLGKIKHTSKRLEMDWSMLRALNIVPKGPKNPQSHKSRKVHKEYRGRQPLQACRKQSQRASPGLYTKRVVRWCSLFLMKIGFPKVKGYTPAALNNVPIANGRQMESRCALHLEIHWRLQLPWTQGLCLESAPACPSPWHRLLARRVGTISSMSASTLWTPTETFQVLHTTERKTNRWFRYQQKTFSTFERQRWPRIPKVQGFSTIRLLLQRPECLVKWSLIRARQQRAREEVELLQLLQLTWIVCPLIMSKKWETKDHDRILSELRAELKMASKASLPARSNWPMIPIWIIHHSSIICQAVLHRAPKAHLHNNSSNQSPTF